MSIQFLTEEEIFHKLASHKISRDEAMALLQDIDKNAKKTSGGQSNIKLTTGLNPADDTGNNDYTEDKVAAEIIEIVTGSLHIPESELSHNLSFKDLGIDSINGVEIVRDINRSFGLNLDAVILYDYSTVLSLTGFVYDEIRKNSETYRHVIRREKEEASGDPVRRSKTRIILEQKPETDEVFGRTTDVYETKEAETGSYKTGLSAVEDYIDNNTEDKVAAAIIEIVSGSLHIPESDLRYDLSFKDLGVDSINGVEIVRDINRNFGLNLDAVILYDCSTVLKLTEFVFGEIRKNSETFSHVVRKTTGKTVPKPEAKIALKLSCETEINKTVYQNKTGDLQKVSLSNHNFMDFSPPLVSEKSYVEQPGPLEIDFFKTRDLPVRDKMEQNKGTGAKGPQEIAIIGMSGRFPGARNIDEFWENLKNGTHSVANVPKERWDTEQYYDPDPKTPNKSYSKVGGFLTDIDKFDTLFFNIPPIEAMAMDPQQRLFLEEVWKAIEDAGYSDNSLSNIKCGVFVGAGHGDYEKKLAQINNENSGEAFTGMAPSILASRISYFLNLTGPCITIDTACSSSLVALHLACQSIQSGESDMAIVGGVRLMVTPDLHILSSKIEILSRSGLCKAFDQTADGTIMSEGVGALILKPLEKALTDKHQIYAVIKGSGINQDGKTNGITAPSVNSQTQLELDVYKKSNINPAQISLIEAHGTGTKLGDPIEVKALTNAFRKYTPKKQFCAIGSVKSNIGHATMAAGVASIIKTLLALKHHQIPPTLHFKEANEHINFPETPFYVNTKLTDWSVEKGIPRMAAVSSFGFSGTNAHVVVAEFVNQGEKRAPQRLPFYFIPVSAKTQAAFDEKINDLAEWLEKNEADCFIGDIAKTLLTGRSHFQVRGALIVQDVHELKSKLKEISQKGTTPDYFVGKQNVMSMKAEPLLKEFIKGVIADLQNNGPLRGGAYKEKLAAVADFYVKGYEIDFKGWYTGEDYRFIHLPTYPFGGDHYWIDENANASAAMFTGIEPAKLHPLIDMNVSTFEEQSFEKTFTGEEFYLKDHLVGNDKILPAVAYLEMAKVAGDLANHKQKVVKIIDNTWLNFIKLAKPGMKVHISLYPVTSSQVEYEVVSRRENGSTVVHGKGKIIYETPTPKRREPEFVDIEAIRQRCRQTVSGERCYELFRMGQLNLGKSFQSIQELYVNDSEILSVIKLPEHLKGAFKQYNLHPTLMDGALEAVIGFANSDMESGRVRLPFLLGEIEILGDLTENCYSYVKYMGTKKAGFRDVERFDVAILNEKGQIVIKMKEFSTWDLDKVQQTPAAGPSLSTSPNSTLFSKIKWEKSAIASNMIQNSALGANLLIFDTDADLFTAMKERFSSESQRIIMVKPSEKYQESEADNIYEINPAQKEDYGKLISSLAKKDYLPENIIYMWSKEPFSGMESLSVEKLDSSIYPALYLTQTLVGQKSAGKIKLIYAYHGDRGTFSPLCAAFSGFARSLGMEHPRFLYKTVRIEPSVTEKAVCDMLLTEFEPATEKDLEIIHEDGQRYVKKLSEMDLEAEAKNAVPDFTANGVYLISGGLGSLGFMFARYLAREYKVRLCLTDRFALDAQKEVLLKEIESLGSEVLYIKSDISQRNEVEALLSGIKSKFGKINGIIHGAGINKDSYAVDKTKENMDEVLNPKIWGTVNLDLVTQNEELDFFAVFSSTAAIIGNLGQTDYAYANSFMDYYVRLREELRQKGKRHGKALSINWSLWKEGGMKVSKDTGILFETMGVRPLDTVPGIKAFFNGLQSGENQVVVIAGEPAKLRKILGIETEKLSKPAFDEHRGNANLLQKIQKSLVTMVGEILRVKEKDIYLDKDMNEYGFNSLTFTEFTNKINQTFNLELTPNIFFEHTTLNSFAGFLNDEHHDSIYEIFREELKIKTPVVETSIMENFEEEEIGAREGVFNARARFISRESVPAADPDISVPREPIAVIGISGVMPQSENLEIFWDNLVACKDLITEVPPERWNYAALPENISKWGGFMNEVDKFDPLFFGISPLEAEFMDPQQRIFLQTVWETIEDAGYKPSDLSGTRTGLFVGVATVDYSDVLRENDTRMGAFWATGNSHCILANRISYLLNLRGPSEPIDTACSSSLIAIHRGVESIYNGDCEMAIAGGINILLSPNLQISFSKAGMLSPDGRCKTFDKNANGYVRGEGSGAILLKPLRKAVADGDHIYGLVKGTAVNHGGRSASLTAPNPNALAELIMEALEKADFTPDTISYIEAHGTGTKLGDPVEINGFLKAFKELNKKKGIVSDKKEYCGINSVKTNTGHMELAAGIGGVLKVLLAMKHKKLPGIVNFKELNPFIQLSGSPFYIVQKTQYWEPLTDSAGRQITRRAGVNSFGFGGANAHVVLEEYVSDLRNKIPVETPQIVVLSAKNEQRLTAYAERLLEFLEKTFAAANHEEGPDKIGLTDIAYTLQIGREAMEERLAIVVNDIPELIEKLSGFIQGKTNIDDLYCGNAKTNQEWSDFLVDGKAGKEFVKMMIKDGEINKLAQFWVSGIKVDWMFLYQTHCPNRIALPTYPFEKKRIWVPKSNKRQKAEKIAYPLIDKLNKKLSLNQKGVYFQKSLKNTDPIISNHKVQNQYILPEAGYLEIAYESMLQFGRAEQISICNTTWYQPLVINSSAKEVLVVIKEENGVTNFEIQSDEKGKLVVHSRGDFRETAVSSMKDPCFAIGEIKSRCNRQINRETVYRNYTEAGIEYGSFLKALVNVWFNEEEALGQIELPVQYEKDFGSYKLHPTIMDNALQTIGLLAEKIDNGATNMLPFSVKEVEILKPLEKKAYAYVKALNKNEFDIAILNESGSVCVRLRELRIRKIKQNAQQASFNKFVNTYVEIVSAYCRGGFRKRFPCQEHQE